MWGPTDNLCPYGSAVLSFIGYKQTNSDRQAKYINKETSIQRENDSFKTVPLKPLNDCRG